MTSQQDPTRSGPSFGASSAPARAAEGQDATASDGAGRLPVTLSCNEVQMLALKAARGAGLEWGLAEEAGNAVRWLAVRKLPGPQVMAAYLEDLSNGRVTTGLPVRGADDWSPGDGNHLCPVAVGAGLCDNARMIAATGRPVMLHQVARPLLLVPFLGEIAGMIAGTIAMTAGDLTISMAPDGRIDGDCRSLSELTFAEVTRISMGGVCGGKLPECGLPEVSFDVLEALDAMALKTCVPASEQSRTGAGSALSDND